MKIQYLSAFVAVVAVLSATTCSVRAIDANKAAQQARSAPAWATSASVAQSDPLQGFSNDSSDRNRLQASMQPQWSDPTQPSFDPRLTQPLSGSFSPTPTSQSRAPRWRLGIFPEDTETGVNIREVVRGSAAERAGLEVNDRIVAVHGYQVGLVNGMLFDVGQEFERHADSSGWVRVLAQDARNGRLVNLPIKLDSRQQTLSGTITYRDRSALPQDAVATVELREAIRADLQPITVARQTITGGRQIPIAFALDFDPSQIDTRNNYTLHARIESQGRRIYELQRAVPVLGGRANDNIQLLVEATSQSPGSGGVRRSEQMAQISRWFREYLGREPRAQELYVWEAHLDRGGTLADAQLQILSTPEFYFQSNADDTQYVRRMFQMVMQRQPSQQEVSQWLNRLNHYNRLRPEVAREFLASVASAQARR